MQQGSEEWLAFRMSGIGSSDAAVVMGESPYATPFELWLERTGRKERKMNNFAGALGHMAEPHIRNLAEQKLDEIFEPTVILSEEYPYMLASLDGSKIDVTHILECKMNKEDVHDLLMTKGCIPQYHMWQMQHQLLVSGAKKCYYVSAPYRDDFATLTVNDIVIIPVEPLAGMQQDLIVKEAAFVECLANDNPPELMDRDGVVIDSSEWKKFAKQWVSLKEKEAAIAGKRKKVEEHLKRLSENHAIAKGSGVVVKNTMMKGNVQYKKIPELKGVDLDQYRGAGFVKTTFSKE